MAGKMVMGIVHPDDAEIVTQKLTQSGFRVTQAATRGGFLRRGNVTLMIGVDEQDVDQVMQLIRENIQHRSSKVRGLRGSYQEGAVAFVVDMEQALLAE